MKRTWTRTLRSAWAFAITAAVFGAIAAPAAAQDGPNVVLIILDDQNDWVGALGGHPQAETPRIDALAAEGTLFTSAHAGAPLCHPSRVSFMTGMTAGRTGIKSNKDTELGEFQPWREDLPDAVSLNQAFRDAGYDTVGLGKVYHGNVANHDTDNWDTYMATPTSAMPPAGEIPINGFDMINRGGAGAGDWGVVEAPVEEFEDQKVGTWAVDYINGRDPNDTQPFFLALGLRSPHSPWYFPQAYFDRIAGGDTASIALPATMPNDLDDVGSIARGWAAPPPEVPPNPPDPNATLWDPLVGDPSAVRWGIHSYLAAGAFADDQVGRVLDALDAAGLADDTIVVLISDHGYHLSEKQTWLKQLLWEEDTLVPMIFRIPPSVLPAMAATVDEPVSISAIFPTLLELAGIPLPDYPLDDPQYRVDYRSLVPLLGPGGAADWSGPAVTYGRGDDATIRLADTRFTLYRDRFDELYDRMSDPNEWFNIANSPPFAELVSLLTSDALRYLAGEHAPFGYPETCGEPAIDAANDFGVHIWQDCTNTGAREWQLRATAGGTSGDQDFVGDVTSGSAFSGVTGVGLEGGDTITDAVTFDFSVSPGDIDGVEFSFPNGADACLALSTLPAGAGIYVGASRFPASVPLNLSTLEYCGPPIPTGQLGDYVWLDTDGDGAQDPEESGYEGASIRLLDCADGQEIDSTTTDENGAYLFNTVPAGSFQLRFILPAGYVFSPEAVGVAGGLDSDADPATGLTRCADMAEGQIRLGFDAGLVESDTGPLPSLSIDDVSADEDAGELLFTVSLTGGTTTSDVSFSASTADGTAVANTDYTPLDTEAGTIAAGETTTTISVPLVDDSAVEPDETLTLTLADVSSNVTVSNGTGTGTIVNDDVATPPPPPPSSGGGGGGAFGGVGLLLLLLARAIGGSKHVVAMPRVRKEVSLLSC